ncbi:MAG: ATP-binding cassette domain-containing protein [Candidatus Aureabacteria bacterium]|nr:ATP-binding cassette domain-containing protein [Candidatus Auribacterota bacterium]
MDSTPIIEIKNLCFYHDQQLVLKDVNLRINAHEFLVIIGPNGGGKTTLLKLLLGLYKPARGSIKIFGKAPQDVLERIGYIPQQTDVNNLFPISVMDVVLTGIRGKKFFQRNHSPKHVEKARSVLKRMGVWELKDSRIGNISGGQRRRVLIARALIKDPEILMLDEPTASVDTDGQQQFYETLNELNKNMTILLVTHDISVISKHVHTVACMNQKCFYHDRGEITEEMIQGSYGCHLDLIAHGKPHRMLGEH